LRGGNEYAILIRKTEPKPLRIFLQVGSNDLDIYAGSWWNANQTASSFQRPLARPDWVLTCICCANRETWPMLP
jgi:hypothetical protein